MHTDHRFIKITAIFTAFSLITGSFCAFGAESGMISKNEPGEVVLLSSETQSGYTWKDIEAPTDEETYDTNFSGLSGNFLLAINPEPWFSERGVDKVEVPDDKKGKHIGYMPEMRFPREFDKSTEAGEPSFHQCKTMELLEKHPVNLTPRTTFLNTGKTEYKVGDVCVRLIQTELAGEPGRDYNSENGVLTSRVYQCLYTGEVSTIWGSISENNLTAEEKDSLMALHNYFTFLLEEDEITPDEEKPYLQGLIGFSEDRYRTCVPSDYVNGMEEFGRKFDHYIKKEREYTGDFLETDRKYGDNDEKAAFLFEPMSYACGYFELADLDPLWAGDGIMDCLHLDVDRLYKGEENEVFGTVLHELQHCILFGYRGYDNMPDTWINEWMAQTVIMQVCGDWREDIEGYSNFLPKKAVPDHLIYPFAYGNDTKSDPKAEDNLYSISFVLGKYFIEHVDDRFVQKITVELNDLSTGSISDYFKEKSGHGLSWWLSTFSIAFLTRIDGTEVKAEKDSAYDIGTSETALKTLELFREKYKETATVNDVHRLSKNLVIPGGGTVLGFEYTPVPGSDDCNTPDRTFDIRNIGKGVVWALRDSNGNIVNVSGLEYLEENEQVEEENKGQDKPSLNPDGSWSFSDRQKELLSLIPRSARKISVEGTDAVLNLNLCAREALIFNADKKALASSLIDISGSSVSVNGTDIRIKKVVLKNPKKAYISENSIFRDTVSENNLKTYASFPDKKKPGYYLILDTKGLSGDIKKTVKKANRQMKKHPFPVDILPVTFSKSNLKAEKNAKNKIKKAVITFEDGSSRRLKSSASGKKDFTTETDGNLIIITGTNNYNGKYVLSN